MSAIVLVEESRTANDERSRTMLSTSLNARCNGSKQRARSSMLNYLNSSGTSSAILAYSNESRVVVALAMSIVSSVDYMTVVVWWLKDHQSNGSGNKKMVERIGI